LKVWEVLLVSLLPENVKGYRPEVFANWYHFFTRIKYYPANAAVLKSPVRKSGLVEERAMPMQKEAVWLCGLVIRHTRTINKYANWF
jgi:hypothetical protein